MKELSVIKEGKAPMSNTQNIHSTLQVREDEESAEQTKAELKVADPDNKQARAVLQKSESESEHSQ